MTSKEYVKRTVEFKSDGSVPIFYFNRDTEKSDIIMEGLDCASDFTPAVEGQSEWGFVWSRLDETMGQPKFPPLENGYDDMSRLLRPNPDDGKRYMYLKKRAAENPDKYIIANLGISGFNTLTFIRGFEQTLEDLYLEPENLMGVMNIVKDFELGLIRNIGKIKGVDAVGFYDDWGTQNSLMIAPDMFRKFFKPIYKEQFDLIHSLGMHVFFHSCGQVYDIIEDLIEVGADIINLNQPDIFPMEKLEKFRGRICFNCPVDHQTTAISGTKSEIFNYTKRLKKSLATEKGGFIANIEWYASVGMSEDNYQYISQAFEQLRRKV